MNQQRLQIVTDAPVLGIPRQRRSGELERAAAAVEEWLDAQDLDGVGPDTDAELLRTLSELAIAQAPESVLADAVLQARDAGWDWAPIAMLLGETPGNVKNRFAARVSTTAKPPC